MKKGLLLLIIFLLSLSAFSQTKYRAFQKNSKTNNEWSGFTPDHSLIIIDSKELSVKIKSGTIEQQYYLYGLPEEMKYDDGEEAVVYRCRDENSRECLFVLRGKEHPIFEIRFSKSKDVICYYANYLGEL